MVCLILAVAACRALALILLVPIPLRHPLLKYRLQLPMMPPGHLAKLATVGIQERACGLPATDVRDGITASVLEYRSRKPCPGPTHAMLAPRHAIDHLHNHVNAHSLAFSMHDYPCPNIMYISTTSGIAGAASSPRREFLRKFVLGQDVNMPKWIRCKRKIT